MLRVGVSARCHYTATMDARTPFHTIGHSTHEIADFIGLLKQAGIVRLIDVRSIRRSRTNPQFNQDTLPAALAPDGIAYTAMADLGGRRSRQHNVAPEVNGYWENASFHNYADYALQPAFRAALAELRTMGHTGRCAIMCAEVVWWRCHRRIIADHLLAAGEIVCHILPDRIDAASLTPGARLNADGLVTYPAV